MSNSPVVTVAVAVIVRVGVCFEPSKLEHGPGGLLRLGAEVRQP